MTISSIGNSGLDALARELMHAQDHFKCIPTYSDRIAAFSDAAGYEVAQLVHQARIAAGSRPVGRKIGFTNREMWRVFNASEPIWAYVYDTTIEYLTASAGVCRIGALREPLLEPEIVLHFSSTPQTCSDPSQLLACIDWIAHAFEIVVSPFPDWTFKSADCIAASACHHRLLIGEPQPLSKLGMDVAATLEQFTVELFCDSTRRATGRGANVLGSPLAAMNHLLAVLSTYPGAAPIVAGDLVTTGTLTAAPPIRVGEMWHTAFGGIDLPGLKVSFES